MAVFVAVFLVAGAGAAAFFALGRRTSPRHAPPTEVAVAPAEPTFHSKVERGAWVFTQRGCPACHGAGGSGGVANTNYVLGTVPALNQIADKIGLYERADGDAFIRMIETGANLDAPGLNPTIEDYARVLAQYHAIRTVIENGATAGKLDPAGPQPPLSMPSWKNVIPSSDIDCVIAYLVSVMPWDQAN